MRRSPPFTASLSVHVLILLVLALLVTREQRIRRLTLKMSFASDEAGDGAGDVVTIAPAPQDAEADAEPPTSAPADLDAEAPSPPADQPEPEPEPPRDIRPDPMPPAQVVAFAPASVMPQVEPLDTQPASSAASGDAAAPDVTQALTGRAGEMKQALLSKAGGGAETEAAVAKALEWLAKKQGRDGLWSLRGPYPDGSNQENRLAATAMALLAFQGAGTTPRDGAQRELVARGWKAVLASQAGDGTFDLGSMPDQHSMYAHAQTTIAVCELLAMTGDKSVRPAAQRALDYCVAAQMPDGGWRYRPPRAGADSDNKGDMSVTGWFMMALKTAETAGLSVPSETYAGVGRFLDAVFISDAKGYGYQILPHRKFVQVRPALTAEALLCRQYLGWPHDDPRLAAGMELLFRELPFEFAYPHKNVYAWYYTTQVCRHAGGTAWERWNGSMRPVLTGSQVARGPESGSWDPVHDIWGHLGGRLFTTCLCTYMLEAYYRHLPLAAER